MCGARACGVVLATLIAGLPAGRPVADEGRRIAGADHWSEAGRDPWFRVGDLLSDAVRKLHRDDRERAPDGDVPGSRPVDPPEVEPGPPNGRPALARPRR